MEGDAAAALSRLVAKGKADAAAGWSLAVTRGLTRVVHRLSIARKAKRQPLPEALAAMEALLGSAYGAYSTAGAQLKTSLEEEEAGGGSSGGSGCWCGADVAAPRRHRSDALAD